MVEQLVEGGEEDKAHWTQKYIDAAKQAIRRCLAHVLKSSPPELCDEVSELLQSLGIKPSHLLQLYATFHELRQGEVDEAALHRNEDDEEGGETWVTVATVIESRTTHNLVLERRKYVRHLLDRLLKLGDIEDEISWNSFLWIFLRFCSLNRVELSQCLFNIIAREVQSDTHHYLTYHELTEFYSYYKNCPVKAFSTNSIDFERLPLSRYYVSDFTELLQRFTMLLNPLLHLQQSLQAFLPSSDFWDNIDQSHSFTRKITMEFFAMNPPRVFLRGEPPFRETCDMLAPDALGPKPVNQDQWITRTAAIRLGNAMHQVSVWGEQLPPEMSDLLEEKRLAWEKAQAAASKKRAARQSGSQPPPPMNPFDIRGAQNPKKFDPMDPDGHGLPKAQGSEAPTAVGGAAALQPAAKAAAPALDPEERSRAAALLNEEFAGPLEVLPPPWMRRCAKVCAPAPVIHGPDHPLDLMRKRGLLPPPQPLGKAHGDTAAMLRAAIEDSPSAFGAAATTREALADGGQHSTRQAVALTNAAPSGMFSHDQTMPGKGRGTATAGPPIPQATQRGAAITQC